MGKMLKITWKKSTIGKTKIEEDCIRSLGLKRLNQTVVKDDTPSMRGIVQRVRHLLTVEEL